MVQLTSIMALNKFMILNDQTDSTINEPRQYRNVINGYKFHQYEFHKFSFLLLLFSSPQ